MEKLWKQEYNLNIPKIDEQHRRFFEMLESTIKYFKRNEITEKSLSKLFRTLMDLRSYGLFHFYTEEKLMIKSGYPDFLDHMEIHDEFFTSINMFRSKYLKLFKSFCNSIDNKEDIADFINDFTEYTLSWYQEHISKEDSKYVFYILRLSGTNYTHLPGDDFF